MSEIVRMSAKNRPPMTEAEVEELRVLMARPDEEIDLSDIPEMTAEQWSRAVRGGHYRPAKSQVTAKLDRDVIDWLKADGCGYQTRMNAILRREMLQSRAAMQK